MAEPLLELRDVRAGYGEAVVLDGVSIALPANGSLAVLGRNGVGKTTLLLTVMGFVKLARGSVRLDRPGHLAAAAAPRARARPRLGAAGARHLPFAHRRGEPHGGRPARSLGPRSGLRLFPRLKERRANMGNQLSGGEQQMADDRAHADDQPVDPACSTSRSRVWPRSSSRSWPPRSGAWPRTRGMALVLVEQHAELALKLTEEAVVIERGVIAHRGPVSGAAARSCDARPPYRS